MDGTLSDWKAMLVSLSQDAFLSPLLHSIYGADISRRPGIEMSQLTDDTAAFTSNNINCSANNLQSYTVYLI
jgi:hypothetical protein